MSALLRRVVEPVDDAVPDLASTGPRERLAGRTTCDQLDSSVLDQLSDACDAFGLPEIPAEGQAAEVVPMGLSGFLVPVDPQHHAVARHLKAKAQPTSPAEQVGRKAVPVRTESVQRTPRKSSSSHSSGCGGS